MPDYGIKIIVFDKLVPKLDQPVMVFFLIRLVDRSVILIHSVFIDFYFHLINDCLRHTSRALPAVFVLFWGDKGAVAVQVSSDAPLYRCAFERIRESALFALNRCITSAIRLGNPSTVYIETQSAAGLAVYTLVVV